MSRLLHAEDNTVSMTTTPCKEQIKLNTFSQHSEISKFMKIQHFQTADLTILLVLVKIEQIEIEQIEKEQKEIGQIEIEQVEIEHCCYRMPAVVVNQNNTNV